MVDLSDLPETGTCELTTVGRRSGRLRRVETWYVVVDGRVVLTGTPGTRHWLANLRAHPDAVLRLGPPVREWSVTASEVTGPAARTRVATEAWRLQPWYAQQPYTLEDWVARSPMVALTPGRDPDPQAVALTRGSPRDAAASMWTNRGRVPHGRATIGA